MKKLSFILLALIFTFASCTKDDDDTIDDNNDNNNDGNTSTLAPTATQNGFAINYTATWCTYCGKWGAELIHDYSDGAPNGAIIAGHAGGDPMTNSLYASFTNDRTTGGGIPSFWVGDSKTTASGAMSSLIAGGDAAAGVDYTYEVSGNTMTIKTKTKFFSALSGDIFLSVLVLEDGINGNSTAGQYVQGGVATSYPNDDYKHDYVLRESSVDGEAYGEKISSSPASGASVEKTYTITLDPSWNNPYPVAIVWQFAAGNAPEYKYINSLKKK